MQENVPKDVMQSIGKLPQPQMQEKVPKDPMQPIGKHCIPKMQGNVQREEPTVSQHSHRRLFYYRSLRLEFCKVFQTWIFQIKKI